MKIWLASPSKFSCLQHAILQKRTEDLSFYALPNSTNDEECNKGLPQIAALAGHPFLWRMVANLDEPYATWFLTSYQTVIRRNLLSPNLVQKPGKNKLIVLMIQPIQILSAYMYVLPTPLFQNSQRETNGPFWLQHLLACAVILIWQYSCQMGTIWPLDPDYAT